MFAILYFLKKNILEWPKLIIPLYIYYAVILEQLLTLKSIYTDLPFVNLQLYEFIVVGALPVSKKHSGP